MTEGTRDDPDVLARPAARIRTAQRSAVVSEVADVVAALHPGRIVLVGVDGVDGAGKTVFADELAEAVGQRERPAIRAGVDGFHHPRSVRYRRGRHSPAGYFHDSYDYDLMHEALIGPLSQGGHRRYRTACFDHRTDQEVEEVWQHAPADAVLIVDGIFLHRPELRRHWDYSVFLQAGFDVTFRRLAQRDDSDPDPSAPPNRRYVEGQRLYLDQCRPAEQARVVIDNSDLAVPVIMRRS